MLEHSDYTLDLIIVGLDLTGLLLPLLFLNPKTLKCASFCFCSQFQGGNGRFNMRYALVPKSLTTIGVMDISDTLLAVSTAVNEALSGPCSAAPPALFCSYVPNSLMCAPSPPLVWNQDLSQLLTLC